MSQIRGPGVAGVASIGGASRLHRPVGGGNQGPSFADTLKAALGDVQQSQDQAQNMIGKYVRGEPVELHEVMMAAEEAGIALETLVAVRNKLTDAYRAVIQMQS
jgi:flagellar hook-basal body complex protein FliE